MGSPRPARRLPSACLFLCDPPTASDDAIWALLPVSSAAPAANAVSARAPSGFLPVGSRTGSQQRTGLIGVIRVGDGSEISPGHFPRLLLSYLLI